MTNETFTYLIIMLWLVGLIAILAIELAGARQLVKILKDILRKEGKL